MARLEPTQVNLFVLISLVVHIAGIVVGVALGSERFGLLGGIIGAALGFGIGHFLGNLPDQISMRMLFRRIHRSTNDQLWKTVDLGLWNFCQTLALLELAGRGENVRGTLPRIVAMLESDKLLTRIYGWDAIRLVFDAETKIMNGYDPHATLVECRSRAATLKRVLKEQNRGNVQ
jgi:hypothetical protein